jgi:hypothetical protein
MKNVDSEKFLERKIVELVKAKKGKCIKLLSNHITGLPDRMCLFPGGKILFIELKTTGQKPRRSQVIMHNALRALGFQVEVIDTLSRLKEVINSVC